MRRHVRNVASRLDQIRLEQHAFAAQCRWFHAAQHETVFDCAADGTVVSLMPCDEYGSSTTQRVAHDRIADHTGGCQRSAE